jgi:hypothetical protein
MEGAASVVKTVCSSRRTVTPRDVEWEIALGEELLGSPVAKGLVLAGCVVRLIFGRVRC